MELFDEKIEQMVLEKEYEQLTIEEKEEIREFISNEEEYAQFRMTLLMASDVKTENIQPKEATKASLMQMMENSRPERKIWYNSMGAFFFPEDKPAFAKPGVYAALAAILLLVFVFVPMDFGKVGVSNENVAANEDRSKGDGAAKEEMAPMEEDIVSASEVEPSMDADKDINKLKEESIVEDQKNEELITGGNRNDEVAMDELEDNMDDNIAFSMGEKGGGADGKKKTAEGNTFTIDYSAGVYPNKALGAAQDSTTLKPAAPGVITRTNDKTVNFKEEQKNFISGDLKKDGFGYEILNDNALNQNTDLIDLLYTAE